MSSKRKKKLRPAEIMTVNLAVCDLGISGNFMSYFYSFVLSNYSFWQQKRQSSRSAGVPHIPTLLLCYLHDRWKDRKQRSCTTWWKEVRTPEEKIGLDLTVLSQAKFMLPSEPCSLQSQLPCVSQHSKQKMSLLCYWRKLPLLAAGCNKRESNLSRGRSEGNELEPVSSHWPMKGNTFLAGDSSLLSLCQESKPLCQSVE